MLWWKDAELSAGAAHPSLTSRTSTSHTPFIELTQHLALLFRFSLVLLHLIGMACSFSLFLVALEAAVLATHRLLGSKWRT